MDPATTSVKLQNSQNVVLSKMSEGELPKLSAKAGCLARVKRTLELSILISEKNPYSLQFYENLTTIRKLRMRQIATGSTIIHCFSDFR